MHAKDFLADRVRCFGVEILDFAAHHHLDHIIMVGARYRAGAVLLAIA
ncbi:MAG: hypothetical protein RBU29_11290 [bacterium]|nr:hypothetical protein [bacterium]